MKLALNNGFNELSLTETQKVNGGFAHIYVLWAVTTAFVGFNVGVAINKDLTNCYNNGYNEVIKG